MRNSFGALCMAAAAALAAATPAAAQTKINVAHVFANDFLPVFISKDNGCFEKRGLDVTLTLIPIISNIPATLVSGSAQIGATTPPTMLPAVENGLDLMVVANSSRMMANNPTFSVVMKQDVKVATVQDLKGKRIAVPGLNSLGDVTFRKWLNNAGVKTEEVNRVEAPIPQMADMLKGGTVDAIVIMEPIRSRVVSGGIGYRHPIEFYATTAPDSVATMWIATGAWAKANAKAVSDFRACIDEGINVIKTKIDEAKKVELKYVKANSPVYPQFELKITPADLKMHVDMATAVGVLKKPVDLAKIVLP